MTNNFFQKFSEDTNVKLKLYENYLTEWLPVFIASHNPITKNVNILDLFCGPGMDGEGTLGSPLLTLKVLNGYKEIVSRSQVNINLYFNDRDPDYIEELKGNIKDFGDISEKIKINLSNEDFKDFYPEINKITKGSANLIFLDQFGIKYVNEEKFIELSHLPMTDLIFFISSSTFKRFHSDSNVNGVLGLDSDEIQEMEFYKIHQLVHKAYTEFIPENHSYGLAPFSIKKGSNVYGLIFGSGHPLGLEKFLDICWKEDEFAGEANFDIHGDEKAVKNPTLFAEQEQKNMKINVFKSNLEEKVLSGELKTDLDIYLYALNRGFIGKHIKPVISNLKSERKISLKYPSFRCNTVWKTERIPKEVKILNQ